MLATIVDKLGSFFDRGFTISYWAPAFVALSLIAFAAADAVGWSETVKWWDVRSGTEQGLLTIGATLLVTTAAVILQAYTLPIVQLFEGYWRGPLAVFGRPLRARQAYVARSLSRRLKSESDETQRALLKSARYFSFPRDPRAVRPTQLGSTLTSAEQHAWEFYRINGPLWWPRLFAVLPDGFKAQLEAATTPMVGLINLSAALAISGVAAAGVVWWFDARWWMFVATFLIPLAAAWSCYRAAVAQASGYGNLLRVAFDLYRHKILEAMAIPLPDGLQEERVLWASLNEWLYLYVPFAKTSPALDPAQASMLPYRAGKLYYEYAEPEPVSDDGE